ncbi:alpha-ketoglutarate-dependent dioxygenase AlkB [Flavobacterium jejuense]|uniref:Alpha-ketoglutarate-dependent dioxygenase AlkB n=1 Tax=Flavobacterium jejuense TaxID=1544455 RepID=A0ABX0IPI0_9FLAO|nr:alpha-ketoglutarate-dependent dioxygenase AlkB [Flavobacterium jejuense]NHN24373.1 alpha-ketoglutarate-dependent dioxygenase AlkB [Flavobacterium jejuense]
MKLPLNCIVEYIDDFLNPTDAIALYDTLINNYNIDKSQLIIEAGGKTIATDSFKILFATERLIDLNSHPENIHGKVYVWSGIMKKLKMQVEALLNKEFELAMCIYYPNGEYFAPYHFDQQTSGYKTILPSISLGEVREFSFKENETGEVYSLDLANGSLLIMKDYTQERYMHTLTKNSKYQNGRINITFREPNFQ